MIDLKAIPFCAGLSFFLIINGGKSLSDASVRRILRVNFCFAKIKEEKCQDVMI